MSATESAHDHDGDDNYSNESQPGHQDSCPHNRSGEEGEDALPTPHNAIEEAIGLGRCGISGGDQRDAECGKKGLVAQVFALRLERIKLGLALRQRRFHSDEIRRAGCFGEELVQPLNRCLENIDAGIEVYLLQ